MAEGKPSDFVVVPTKDTSLFHLRVRLSPEEHRPGVFEETNVVVGGCRCTAYYAFSSSDPPDITVAFEVLDDPVLEGAAEVSTLLVLLDKNGSPAPSIGTGWAALLNPHMKDGYTLLASWYDVMANCVVDNYLVVLCSVHIAWKPQASLVKKSLVKEELSDLGHDLAMMSDKQELTDVSFEVGGESFSAHRLVFATRSPVFRAQLYGQMAESKMTSITIQDMEASTFRSMLHYMYHGSLPDAGPKDVSLTMAEYQHLIIAADRYGVEGLKKICEEKLCGNGITIDNVVSMLELAEDHGCPKLKTGCFDFLADGEKFKLVATSAEYLHLMQSFPTLLVEVRNRFKTAHEKPGMFEPAAHKKT